MELDDPVPEPQEEAVNVINDPAAALAQQLTAMMQMMQTDRIKNEERFALLQDQNTLLFCTDQNRYVTAWRTIKNYSSSIAGRHTYEDTS